MEGRISAEKEVEHVIPTCWWEAIDTELHEQSGEFRRAFRMSRKRFNLLADFIVEKWTSVHGIKSFECAQAEKGGIRMQAAIALHWASLDSGFLFNLVNRPTNLRFFEKFRSDLIPSVKCKLCRDDVVIEIFLHTFSTTRACGSSPENCFFLKKKLGLGRL
jgi:hypothetical protein